VSATCQWIGGDPSGDDSCKCGEPVPGRGVYCEWHHAATRTYRRHVTEEMIVGNRIRTAERTHRSPILGTGYWDNEETGR